MISLLTNTLHSHRTHSVRLLGVEWRGLSVSVQFYGVTNVTRYIQFPTFARETHTAFNEGSYWSVANPSGKLTLPRWTTTTDGSASGTRYYYDGAFLRLKNAEIAYTFSGIMGTASQYTCPALLSQWRQSAVVDKDAR
jgi:hypothetical protein